MFSMYQISIEVHHMPVSMVIEQEAQWADHILLLAVHLHYTRWLKFVQWGIAPVSTTPPYLSFAMNLTSIA